MSTIEESNYSIDLLHDINNIVVGYYEFNKVTGVLEVYNINTLETIYLKTFPSGDLISGIQLIKIDNNDVLVLRATRDGSPNVAYTSLINITTNKIIKEWLAIDKSYNGYSCITDDNRILLYMWIYRYTANDVLSDTEIYELGKATTSVAKNNNPDGYSLKQNYPNPFNSMTRIDYEISVPGEYMINIFDATGKTIESLKIHAEAAGSYSYMWQAKNLSSGVYFYQLEGEQNRSTKKMIYLK